MFSKLKFDSGLTCIFIAGDKAARKLNDKMSKAQYRGLSTPERLRVVEDDFLTKTQESEESERTRSRSVSDQLTAFFPHSVRLWVRQVGQDYSLFSSPRKPGIKSSESGSRLGKSAESGGVGPLNSSTTGVPSASPRDQTLGSKFFSILSCGKTTSTSSFLPLFLLCVIGAFVFITVTGNTRPYPKVLFPAHNYRRAQLLVWNDLYHGGILGLGSLKPKEVSPCPAGMEDFVPCYNVTANSEAGYVDGLQFERHCEVSGRKQCLIPPPRDYKIPLKWPDCRDGIWPGNLQVDMKSKANKHRFLVEVNRLKFPSSDPRLMDDVERYADRMASRLDLESHTEFQKAKIRTVLDIGCGSSSLGALLWSHEVVTMCVAPYEPHGGQVQLALERGLPAIIGSFVTAQLPYPSSAFDLIHCSNCGIKLYQKSGKPIIEVDRLLRPGGYFVWAKPLGGNGKPWEKMQNVTSKLCWDVVSPSENEQIVIWKKRLSCFGSVIQTVTPNVCDQGRYEPDWPWHQPLRSCITLSPPARRVSVQKQPAWPSRMHIPVNDPSKTGPGRDEVTGEPRTWMAAVAEYWSLLTPIIFSDHPKRLGDEDVQPAVSIVRNVMDLNAGIGAFNAALLQTGKLAWVMNVVPTSATNTLPFIFDRGLFGVNHDWCEPFPTYPRTYDLLHASDLLSQERRRPRSCGLSNLFSEMDRILRPEGWVILRDDLESIEDARLVAIQMRWESRMVEVPGDSEQRLLVCQKTFWKA
ncbi:hypothetical protein R1sor_017002 [Riccia sorocarpa]|uniref:Methyltransferase n=1 Tax=Riccia sorocarpa TaxID=122646 RepID=A0ABD3I947_9MARC